MIPCLCSFLFTVPSSPSAELVGAKLLHLLTQTALLLKHPTGVFVAVANAKPPINKNVPEPFFIKNRVRVRTVWWTVQDSNVSTLILRAIIRTSSRIIALFSCGFSPKLERKTRLKKAKCGQKCGQITGWHQGSA